MYSQSGNIQWQRSLGGTDIDGATHSRILSDKSVLIVGSTYSSDGDIVNPLGSSDAWVIKLDSTGIIQWSRTLGGSGYDAVTSFDLTFDGGFILGGTTTSNDSDVSGNHGESDYWIVKTDSIGNIAWQKCYGGTEGEGVSEIQQTPDSGYIVAGITTSTDGDVVGQHSCHGCDPDFWILKLDKIGNLEWQRCLGGMFWEGCKGISQTTNGGYVAVGNASSNNGDVNGCHGLVDYWVVKLSAAGVLQWQRCLGGSGNDAANAVISTNDGGCLVFGEASSLDGDVTGNHGSWDAWLVKLDSTGNIVWQKSYGGSGSDSGKSLAQLNDSTIFLLSSSQSNDSNVTGNNGYIDYWVTKIDRTGNILWENCYGGSNFDMPTSIFVSNEQEFLLTGFSQSNDGDVTGNHGGNCGGFVCDDIWVVKINDTPVSVSEISFKEDLEIYPNPFNHSITIRTTDLLKGNISVLNTFGTVVSEHQMTDKHSIDLSQLRDGIYFLKYEGKNRSITKKIVKIN